MDLVLLVCLATSPNVCREERVAVSVEQTDPRMCMVGAVPTIAEWTESNPDWNVRRWTCGRMTRAAALDSSAMGR